MRFALLAIICGLAGCTRYEYRLPNTGASLQGTVTYGNETVQMAQIDVLGDKAQAIGQIEGGRYKVENVPLGEVKIGVNTEAVRSNMIGQQMARAKGVNTGPVLKFVAVPAKFADPETSGITTTIKRGQNTLILSDGGRKEVGSCFSLQGTACKNEMLVLRGKQLSHDGLEDAAVLVVIQLDRRIDSEGDLEGFGDAVG